MLLRHAAPRRIVPRGLFFLSSHRVGLWRSNQRFLFPHASDLSPSVSRFFCRFFCQFFFFVDLSLSFSVSFFSVSFSSSIFPPLFFLCQFCRLLSSDRFFLSIFLSTGIPTCLRRSRRGAAQIAAKVTQQIRPIGDDRPIVAYIFPFAPQISASPKILASGLMFTPCISLHGWAYCPMFDDNI